MTDLSIWAVQAIFAAFVGLQVRAAGERSRTRRSRVRALVAASTTIGVVIGSISIALLRPAPSWSALVVVAALTFGLAGFAVSFIAAEQLSPRGTLLRDLERDCVARMREAFEASRTIVDRCAHLHVATASGSWYGANTGRFLVFASVGLTLSGGIFYLSLPRSGAYGSSSTIAMIQWAMILLVSAAVPLASTWCVVSICTGRPRFRISLDMVARSSGVGGGVGLLMGCASLVASVMTPGLSVSNAYTTDGLLGLAALGTTTGFLIGLALSVIDVGAQYKNSLWGWMLATATFTVTTICWGAVALSPRKTAAIWVRSATAEIGPLSSDYATAVKQVSRDWRYMLATPDFISSLPSGSGFAAVLITVFVITWICVCVARYRASMAEG